MTVKCPRCSRKTIPEAKWRVMPAEERQRLTAEKWCASGKDGFCRACSVRARRDGWSEVWREGEIALTGGQWVTRGMIKVWEEKTVTPAPKPVARTPRRAKPKPHVKVETHVKVTSGPNLCDCGCLLLTVGENCPCCRFWAYKNERKTRTYTY